MRKDIIFDILRRRTLMRLLLLVAILNGQWLMVNIHAQITIGGNVYGGGNAGDTKDKTSVKIYGGTIKGGVFGGAKQASVDGSSFVFIDGQHMSDNIVIKAVYGGNDISGNVGKSTVLPDLEKATAVGINDTYNAFVRTSKERTETTGTGESATTKQPFSIFIGSLYGGGNGDYKYFEDKAETIPLQKEDGTYYATDANGNEVATSKTQFKKPVQDKVYLEIMGGTIAYLYGGGNNATVDVATDIYINNESKVTTDIQGEDPENPGNTINLLTSAKWLESMGIASLGGNAVRDDYQFSRVFGGNNKATMRIQPTWHLKNGKIDNLYSGGNEGDMCSSSGLLLEIGKVNPDKTVMVSHITVNNVFGGCRKADVRPQSYNPDTKKYEDSEATNLEDFKFPPGFSARVIIRSGKINNVYGGNDISGHVYGGNAVGVYTSISGNIYGGGNGSYPYTDNADLANTLKYGDYYYNPIEILDPDGTKTNTDGTPLFPTDATTGKKTFTSLQSLEALSKHRPDAEQVSIRVKGTDEDHPTIIGGAIYVGGNSATIRTTNATPLVELKVGSHVIADEVYLGNNGKEMVSNEKPTDVLYIMNDIGTGISGKYTSVDLKDKAQFAAYMDAAAMNLKPKISFDKLGTDGADYDPYTTSFGSFYLGGNVGSMTYEGTNTMNFDVPIYVYNKIVGGCNDAYVPVKYALDFEHPKTDGTYPSTTTALNATYEGGIRGSAKEEKEGFVSDGKIKDRLILNFKKGSKGSVQIKPMRWKLDPDTWSETAKKYTKDTNGNYVLYVNSETGLHDFELNTVDGDGDPTPPVAPETNPTGQISNDDDLARRFDGGNIYGGCHNSGYVNGNVVINLEEDLVDRKVLFDKVQEDDLGEAVYYDNDNYTITERRSGVILGQQGMDVLGKALNVFGGGKGKDTQIWGSTTINLKGGYTFQIFGGSQEGVIGKPVTLGEGQTAEYTFGGNAYEYNDAYSCTINVNGNVAGDSKKAYNSSDMADCEFIYGGGFEGPVCGNTIINLGKGRVFNTFAGACNADILGHTETYIGRQVKSDGTYEDGFPWIRDYVYGGNDLGGEIKGMGDFKSRVRATTTGDSFDVLGKVYNPGSKTDPDVLKANAYIEYTQGRAEGIFAGCYGSYDYTDPKFAKYTYTRGASDLEDHVLGSVRDGFTKPHMDNAFVNFRPNQSLTDKNKVNTIFGAGQGYSGEKEMNQMQDRSYVLIDIPQHATNFTSLEVFGGGSWGGVGMKGTPTEAKANPDNYSAVIDLMRGQINSVYGASYKEGFTRRTVVNVPKGSTINLNSIFGGGYGLQNDVSCDAYEANVNYHSSDAVVKVVKEKIKDKNGAEVEVVKSGGIYGGNNAFRRTFYGKVNIDVPVYANSEKTTYSTVFGAGFGPDTWSQYTEVNLYKNETTKTAARVDEVYGGGRDGMVLNTQSVKAWKDKVAADNTEYTTAYNKYKDDKAAYDVAYAADPDTAGEEPTEPIKPALTSLYTDLENSYSDQGLDNDEGLVKKVGDDAFNTNVYINEGATINRYSYGGGFGSTAATSGTTYITLRGGTANRDIYGGGWGGSVRDEFRAKDKATGDNVSTYGFTAGTNVYIEGGTVRNVYGGSYQGSVGFHEGTSTDPNDAETDIFGETHVTIGKKNGTSNIDGVPAVKRSAYGGGEQGAIYGTTNVTIYDGRIGYYYNGLKSVTQDKLDENGKPIYIEGVKQTETVEVMDFQPELNDPYNGDPGTNKLLTNGNAFGAGYGEGASVDIANIKVYGGKIRGCLFGGGEIAAVGRGLVDEKGDDNKIRKLQKIYKAGQTTVYLYDGHVLRHVFGGGRGYDTWGKGGKLFFTDGYVFGQTHVNIFGGEIGEEETVETAKGGFGNVFGGGDVGFVYSAYDGGTGVKSGTRYEDDDDGFYYKSTGEDGDGNPIWDLKDGNKQLTEDCKVLVEPHCLVKEAVTINGQSYAVGDYVTTEDLSTLKDKKTDASNDGDHIWQKLDDKGIIIHNAVFAGGNATIGSTDMYADEYTVFGNATASIHDIYHRDLITIGTGHTGGLYGDGNLTFVDGYRGLNITNYGTDFYNIDKEIELTEYENLPEREAAYYELRYKCIRECTDNNKKKYYPESGDVKASTITTDELLTLFKDVQVADYVKNSEGEYTDEINKDADGNTIMVPMLNASGEPHGAYWEKNGVCSRYAGRIMNTIQRADFCGVFGSRMVMQGARDRVTQVENTANYTINRVREVSLNKKISTAGDAPTSDAYLHGNYFGIYSNVNFLGALTSDVHFGGSKAAERKTDNKDIETYGPEIKKDGTGNPEYDSSGNPVYVGDDLTFYNWKQKYSTERKRNNGTSHNKVALASGVYLELTSEKSTGSEVGQKDWGLITGVIELDLINVQTGMGGGFVYAKNQHGVPTYNKKTNVTLTALNVDAVTSDDFTYDTNEENFKDFETSGNFVHSEQTIIDDCYPTSMKYQGADKVPAHYWFIKGQVYVYDQYIKAFTGTSNAYSESVDIPLTITAASHGTMTLMSVKPNLYAYYSAHAEDKKLDDDEELEIGEKIYKLNDPISYWDWYVLGAKERALFIQDTYVTVDACTLTNTAVIDEETGNPKQTTYTAGFVTSKEEYDQLRANAPTAVIAGYSEEAVPYVEQDDVDEDGNPKTVKVPFDKVFRSSNNMSHDNGYILTYDVKNPKVWDKYYTPKLGDSRAGKITAEAYADGIEKSTISSDDYDNGPTYRPTVSKLYSQQTYKVGDVISYKTWKAYDDLTKSDHKDEIPGGQATFAPTQAYIVTKDVKTKNKDNQDQELYVGKTIPREDYTDEQWTALESSGSVEKAYLCTSTIELTKEGYKTEYVFVNKVLTQTELNGYKTAYPALEEHIERTIQPAYYCMTAGLYGGAWYDSTRNYRGLDVWSAMSADDRSNFSFNYDALDLLIDKDFSTAEDGEGALKFPEGQLHQYDGYQSYSDVNHETYNTYDSYIEDNKDNMIYSLSRHVDYTATYNGATDDKTEGTGDNLKSYMEYTDKGGNTQKVYVHSELTREQYETLPNEQRYYAPIKVKLERDTDPSVTVYVVNKSFIHGETPYAAGQTIDKDAYNRIQGTKEAANITELTFTKAQAKAFDEDGKGSTYYFCYENYDINQLGMGQSVTGVEVEGAEIGTYTASSSDGVPVGLVINETAYKTLPNKQLHFTIHGISPREYSTLYVSHDADINNLSKEKIITVIFQYNYTESDVSGLHITPVSERHVVNIHISFESGSPTVPDITEPAMVLPGTMVGLTNPVPIPGHYKVTGGGWKLYKTKAEAESHADTGIDFNPSTDPLYWYQDGYWTAYYAMSFLGETYSNHVQVHVANYHDLKDVMDEKNKAHHMYVDYDPVKRPSKIYINDYSLFDMNGLDLLKDFFDLSQLTASPTDGKLAGHQKLDARVKGGNNLEFFLRTDIDYPSGKSWTPIANNDGECFDGILHGDGHTISGLDQSLFKHLCKGEVYNLGVTGTFTGAGVAETGEGYVENCWVSTSNTAAKTTQPVFGTPSRTDDDLVQVVNCYYQEDDEVALNPDGTEADGSYNKQIKDNNESSHGTPIRKPAKAFYNGEVAYDLNGFYLYKRYSLQNPVTTGNAYPYYTINSTDNKLVLHKGDEAGHYASGDDLLSSATYVEERFADGDYRFAGGWIPSSEEREYNDEHDVKSYYPIWPDDYMFFGQHLSYEHVSGRIHDDHPTSLLHENNRVMATLDGNGNRVFRAPAYFRCSDMKSVYFNPNAVFAKMKYEDENVVPRQNIVAHKGLTAIDFSGYNDVFTLDADKKKVTQPYDKGDKGGRFYPPLLDDNGITDFKVFDLTRNLLVYTSTDTPASTKTANTVAAEPKMQDAAYNGAENSQYHTTMVPYHDPHDVYGHRVEQQISSSGKVSYKAPNDHFLVDREDFNAPIDYSMGSNRMWYQRKPDKMLYPDDNYVDLTKGWQSISIPFTAELVTTDQKGEITHFYSGSASVEGSNAKIGHEYWLRECTNIDLKSGSSTDIATANFTYPMASGTDVRDVENTFLWDYYYQGNHSHKDFNGDTYQDEDKTKYYSYTREYTGYPLLTSGVPYLIGFPGATYYEFDLSGSWTARSTGTTAPAKLNQQTITFVSAVGEDIDVSDTELESNAVNPDNSGYYFKPNYLNIDELKSGYNMDNDGGSYVNVAAEGAIKKLYPFRAYFQADPKVVKAPTRSIVFSNNASQLGGEDQEQRDHVSESMEFSAKKHAIVVTSHMQNVADVGIYSASGICIGTFDIQPGETIETPIYNSGVYIIRAAGGHYTHKVTIK